MPVNEQAKAAIAALSGKEIYGRKIALSESREKERHPAQLPARKKEYRENTGEIERDRG